MSVDQHYRSLVSRTIEKEEPGDFIGSMGVWEYGRREIRHNVGALCHHSQIIPDWSRGDGYCRSDCL